jgi:CPA2 family monovalent cation:H+ antiporter-2
MDEFNTGAESAQHLYPLISDLGLILMTAGVSVLLFKWIRQPLVLGYLIAGFLAGPYCPLFPSVREVHNVEVWAEIGVIVLLFSLGLEFSFRKLVRIGGTASVTASVKVIFTIGIGFLTGKLLGWSNMDSIFLGAILSISSTLIILKAFDELGIKNLKFAGIVLGTLIVEDIVAILMLVLLSTISVSQQFSGIELVESVLKLLFFLILWFMGGIFFIPTLLKRSRKLLNDETILIVSLGLCLMMVILANAAGFSAALGAFIMGSIIAETTQAERIEQVVKPVKDLFGAVFFVSVGMLINPQTIVQYAWPVLIITFVTIFGKTISATAGALVSGQPLKQSVQAGMSLAQIGEFSFIIATLGMTLHVTSDFLYPIIVAVSAITTFTTPFMIRWSVPVYKRVAQLMPQKWVESIDRYSTSTQTMKTASNWQLLLKAYAFQILIHAVIVIAIIFISAQYLLPLAGGNRTVMHHLIAFGTLIALTPFLWALSGRRIAVDVVDELRKERKFRGPLNLMILFRILLGVFFIGFFLNIFFSSYVSLLALGLILVIYFIFPHKVQALYDRVEKHFLRNYNDREIAEARHNKSELTPWDGHMTSFEMTQESSVVGKSLKELGLRELVGINIAIIRRGNITINVPNREERIYPGDILYVIGTDEQVEALKKYLEESNLPDPENEASDIVLRYFDLRNLLFIGKDIRQSELREKTDGLVVGIERDGERIINPESEFVLEQDDVLWIVGDKKKMMALQLDKNVLPKTVE